LPILLEGEPGAGHETLARSIHAQSDRRGEPLVKLTIASAAVTPLIKPQPSLDELLQTPSVLYIDDVAEASPRTQSLILERLVRGGRIIAATNACLIPLVKARLFNEQLYYRLSVFPITVPALRNRLEDFGELIQRLLPSFAIEQGKRVETIDGAALRMLKKYAWPGNLAQLEAALYRAVALADDWALQIKDFPQIAAHVDGYGVELPPAPNASGKQARSVPAFVNGVVSKEPAGQGIRALTENGDVRPIDAVEADLIRLALAHYRGHMTEAARRLGIGRSTLYRKIREFGLGASFV
jgi:DNA-binding NtrC family response regulator